MWVRGFRDPTISGRGFNLFKPLRRHFRAGAGPERRVWGTRLPRGEIPSAFSEFSMLCEAENFPPRSSATNSPIADEARRRRFASRGSRLSDGTCGNARPWRFPGVTKGIRTRYHDFVSQKGKVRKSRRRAVSPRRIAIAHKSMNIASKTRISVSPCMIWYLTIAIYERGALSIDHAAQLTPTECRQQQGRDALPAKTDSAATQRRLSAPNSMAGIGNSPTRSVFTGYPRRSGRAQGETHRTSIGV